MIPGRFSSVMFCCLLTIPVVFSPVRGQKVTRLEILNAELTAYDIKIGKDARKLIGNVQLRHEDVFMSCDSAYFYSATGSVDAFSRVTVIQGDTLTLTGDLAHYNGETKIARVRNNVKLVNNDLTLTTDILDYFRLEGVATYSEGGILSQGEQRLTSERGRFMLDEEIFFFMDSVIITDPEYRIITDSLKYDTQTEVSYFFGPTEIITEERYIYCEKGWYDSKKDISFVTDHASMKEDGRLLKGDTLYYEAENGFGRARSNVELYDSTRNTTLRGHFGLYYSETETSMVTDSALMIQVDGSDTMYVHADTLRSIVNPDLEEKNRILKAYYKVKIFRRDMQVMCDSLVYIEADSTFSFHGEPVLWSDENQLTSEKMEVVMAQQKLYRMYLTGISLIISQKDSSSFDQMRGKKMTGFFTDNKLTRIHVEGNGQTVYYAVDQGEIVGANLTKCSDMMIYLKDNRVQKINYITQPDGTYYPLRLLPAEEAKLQDFRWVEQWRPMDYLDVFRWKD